MSKVQLADTNEATAPEALGYELSVTAEKLGVQVRQVLGMIASNKLVSLGGDPLLVRREEVDIMAKTDVSKEFEIPEPSVTIDNTYIETSGPKTEEPPIVTITNPKDLETIRELVKAATPLDIETIRRGIEIIEQATCEQVKITKKIYKKLDRSIDIYETILKYLTRSDVELTIKYINSRLDYLKR